MSDVFHADETTTGELAPALRHEARLVVAAKTDPSDDFRWLLDIEARCKRNKTGEVKAPQVLERMAESPKDTSIVENHIAASSIIVFDLLHEYRELLHDLACMAGLDPHAPDSMRVLLRQRLPADFAEKLLQHMRGAAVENSAVAHVEHLLGEIGVPVGEEKLFDREYLAKLNDQQFREAAVRLTVLLAEILDPDVIADALATPWWAPRRFLGDGEYATLVLTRAIGDGHVFDAGGDLPFAEIEKAQGKILAAIESSMWAPENLKPGALEMEDSQRVLGIRAADLAARIATRIIEQHLGDSESASRALTKRFRRVMFNGEWLR